MGSKGRGPVYFSIRALVVIPVALAELEPVKGVRKPSDVIRDEEVHPQAGFLLDFLAQIIVQDAREDVSRPVPRDPVVIHVISGRLSGDARGNRVGGADPLAEGEGAAEKDEMLAAELGSRIERLS